MEVYFDLKELCLYADHLELPICYQQRPTTAGATAVKVFVSVIGAFNTSCMSILHGPDKKPTFQTLQYFDANFDSPGEYIGMAKVRRKQARDIHASCQW